MDLFHELILIALGKKRAVEGTPTKSDWESAYELAEKHSLIGITYYAIEKTNLHCPNESILMKWYGYTQIINKQNERLAYLCVDVQTRLFEAGFSSCILKGLGIGSLYGELSKYRSTGDIDVWVDASCNRVLDYIKLFSPNREFDAKHAHLNIYETTPVEIHWWPTVTSNIVLGRKLRRFFREQVEEQCKHTIELAGGQHITAASPFFDSIHVLMHIFGHFLYEGITLRQVMDYYFVCIQDEVQKRKEEIIHYYIEFGKLDFAKSLMWVLQETFGLENKYLLTEPNETEGKILLAEILKGVDSEYNHSSECLIAETTIKRLLKRGKRKIRLLKYNFIGVILAPFYKVWLILWKYKMIKTHNL